MAPASPRCRPRQANCKAPTRPTLGERRPGRLRLLPRHVRCTHTHTGPRCVRAAKHREQETLDLGWVMFHAWVRGPSPLRRSWCWCCLLGKLALPAGRRRVGLRWDGKLGKVLVVPGASTRGRGRAVQHRVHGRHARRGCLLCRTSRGPTWGGVGVSVAKPTQSRHNQDTIKTQSRHNQDTIKTRAVITPPVVVQACGQRGFGRYGTHVALAVVGTPYPYAT